jgi:ATP/maltotriose-dependent transcriptional regulator MalT
MPANRPASQRMRLMQYAHRAIVLHRFDDAERAYSEIEAVPRASASRHLFLLGARAAINWYRGDLEAAFPMFEQLRKEYHSLGDTHGEQTTAVNLAEIAYARGQTLLAESLIREILPTVRAGGDKILLVNLLVNLARCFAAANDLPSAAAAAREAIRIRSALNSEHAQVAIAIEHISLVSAIRGDLARAALLEGYADASMRTHESVRDVTETATLVRLTDLLRDRLAAEELTRLRAEGAELAPADAIALALDESEPA